MVEVDMCMVVIVIGGRGDVTSTLVVEHVSLELVLVFFGVVVGERKLFFQIG